MGRLFTDTPCDVNLSTARRVVRKTIENPWGLTALSHSHYVMSGHTYRYGWSGSVVENRITCGNWGKLYEEWRPLTSQLPPFTNMLPQPLRELLQRYHTGGYDLWEYDGIGPYSGSELYCFMQENEGLVLGHLISARDKHGFLHTCRLDCALYNLPAIRERLLKFEKENFPINRDIADELYSADKVEVIGVACDCSWFIGSRISDVLEKFEENPGLLPSDADRILRELR